MIAELNSSAHCVPNILKLTKTLLVAAITKTDLLSVLIRHSLKLLKAP